MKKERIFGWTLIFIILNWLSRPLIWADGGYFSKSQELVAVSADQRAIIIKNSNEISITVLVHRELWVKYNTHSTLFYHIRLSDSI